LCKKYLQDFCVYKGVFGDGPLNAMLPIAFSPTGLRCHGNAIWDKIGYNSVCVRDIREIFASVEVFSTMGY